MASRKRGQKDSGQYTVYNPPTSNLDLLRTRGDKYETRPHPTGQRWSDKVRQDYENRQQMDRTPQTLANIRQPSNTTTTAPVRKAAVVAKGNLRSRAHPVATCQMLDTIEEVSEDSQTCPNFDFGETESEAADLCEILDENSDLDIDEPLIDLAVDQT